MPTAGYTMSERLLLLVVGLVALLPAHAGGNHALRYGFGTPASAARIAAADIAIGPRGGELPAGRGTVAEGAAIYAHKCAACHGASGTEGPDPVLVGGRGTLAGDTPLLTVGSYWRYATTLYDYIYRAMPFVAPGSLKPDEVYALCAWLLNANGIIAADAEMNATTLAAVVMPNRDNFVPDPRPDVAAPDPPQGDTP